MAIDYKLIGSRIQTERKSKKITQEHLAEKLNVSVGYVSQIERGITKPNLEMISEICQIIDCDISYIITGVCYSEKEYLLYEFAGRFSELNDKEKNIVLSLIKSIKENR